MMKVQTARSVPAGRPKARITAVECLPLNIPFKVPFKISSGAPREVMETLLVKVHSDQGVVGIGETQAWRRQGSAETLPALVTIIKKHFEPRLIGRSPFDIAAIMSDLEAAIGDALLDMMGKLLGVPVHDLIGGQAREKVRVAAVLATKGTTSSMLESAAKFTERLYRFRSPARGGER